MKKLKMLLVATAILLIIACATGSGCISNQEDSVKIPINDNVPVIEYVPPTPVSTPIAVATFIPTATPTPKLPETFAGKWTHEISVNSFEETLEFPDERTFTYTLLIKDGDKFFENNRDAMGGSYYKTGFKFTYTGKIIKIANGNYKLRCNTFVVYNDKGQVSLQNKFSDSEMVDLLDFTYDKFTDGLVATDGDQITRFKRIS